MLDFCLYFTYNEDGQQQSPDTKKEVLHHGCRTLAGKER